MLHRGFGAAIVTLWLHLLVTLPAIADDRRPLLVTVDDLPVSAGRLHADPAERLAITRGMLDALARHDITAVGLVTWGNVRDERDLELLEMWLEAGHELGNHSDRHLSYTTTPADEYLADVERAREELTRFLEHQTLSPQRAPRFFRFPMLREGDTPEKLAAAREWLDATGQRNLHVTIDNQDWSFERPWVEARRAGDEARMRDVAEDYHAAMRIAVRHHERTGDELFGRQVPQILLLHTTEVSAAQWDRLFDWLAAEGHRFADADEVLADPAFEQPQAYVGPRGFGLWDRIAFERRAVEAREEIEAMLREQAAAWNRGDLPAFCSVYADDATFLSTTGVHRGREEILERYIRRYGADSSGMGRLTFTFVDFRPAAGVEVSLLGDARPSRVHGASIAARWHLSWPDNPDREDASGLTLIVLRRFTAGWRIVQDASM